MQAPDLRCGEDAEGEAGHGRAGGDERIELAASSRLSDRFKDQIHVFGQLAHLNGTSGGDGGGDHARAHATFLTGARPRKTAAKTQEEPTRTECSTTSSAT